MASTLGCLPNFSRVLLFIINLVFMGLGVIVLILGIVAIAAAKKDGTSLSSSFAGGAGLFIASGTITILISVTGNVGVIFKLRPLLVFYCLVLLLVVVLEIVTGVLVFVFRRNLLDALSDNSIRSISEYRQNRSDPSFSSSINSRVELIQRTFRCCGFNNADDWIVYNPDVVIALGRPPECGMCGSNTVNCTTFSEPSLGIAFNTTGTGCSNPSSRPFTVFTIVIGTLGILFAVFQAFGIMLSCALCCCISRSLQKQNRGDIIEL